jgi:hypothetical protein
MPRSAALRTGLTVASVSLLLLAQTNDCDPNYMGNCVPIVSDVDRAEGKGNGPACVMGPVCVVGTDTYGTDRDKDG